MAEQLTVYQPGDRFATVSREGEARVWEVNEDGMAKIAMGRHYERCDFETPLGRCLNPAGHYQEDVSPHRYDRSA